MSEYYVKREYSSPMKIEGGTIIQAVEDNFSAIVSDLSLGNVAGYTLEKVWMEYDSNILGGNGGVVLHILATGSDTMIHYDPLRDEPKETTVWIGGVKKEELPEPYTFELGDGSKKSTPFDPVDDPAIALGYALAIIDEIATHHARLPEKDSLVEKMHVHYPTLLHLNPSGALSYLSQELCRLQPLKRAKTDKLLSRLAELTAIVMEANPKTLQNDYGKTQLANYRSAHYFYTANKITALTYYRKKVGLTIAALAKETGISDRQLAKYEAPRGTTLGDAKYSAVERIAKALGVTPQDLVQDGLTVLVPADQE